MRGGYFSARRELSRPPAPGIGARSPLPLLALIPTRGHLVGTPTQKPHMPELLNRLQLALADRYRIEGEIGAGGMATVYLAQDLRHDRKVALKLLRPELSAVIGAERFLAEIKLTANLQHPHILPLFDSGEADGFLFYVMPFVEGESLRSRLNREKQLPVAEAVRIATEVASALDYAHRHGVVHRDIKPENILLHDGRALVADFGIALAASKAGGNRMTETGMSLGTPHYMSPRAGDGRARDHRPLRRLRAGRRALRDAHRRPAVHRLDGAGDRGAGAHRDAAPHPAPAPHDPARGRGGGAHRAREAAGGPVRHRGGVRRGAGGPGHGADRSAPGGHGRGRPPRSRGSIRSSSRSPASRSSRPPSRRGPGSGPRPRRRSTGSASTCRRSRR